MSFRPSSQCAVTRAEGKHLFSPGCVEEEENRQNMALANQGHYMLVPHPPKAA